ncbi:MAG: hypothetical protein HY815_06545 [Candidatus Riflebacteria bacterium]|nr:hypothetical protein [Candidatus Riflebacteria bacterium]
MAVHPGATTVLYGDSLDVSARCTGLLPDRMELVICDASGTPGQSVPMFQEDESRWRSQIQDVRHRLEYFVRTPHGRSHRYPIDVTLVPRILQVRVRLTPPGYTGDPPYDGPVPPGGISAVRGSLVDVVVDSNRPLASGELCLFSPRLAPVRVSLVPDRTDPRSVRGRFELRQSGQLRIQVVDARGLASREPFRTSLGVTDDQRPTVQIVSPLPRSVVAPDSVLPVGVEAVDDFGVARITLFRSLNASRHLPVDLPVRGGRARLARSVVSMDLSAYGLLPGDVMTLFARAVDDEPGRPKGSETPIVEVSVVSPAEFARLVKARQSLGSFEVKYRETQRILDTVLESLQRHADQLEDAIARGDETLAGTVIGEMERSARALERSVDWMQSELEAPRELDLDQALRIHLATLRERLTGFRRTLIAARSTARAKALAALRQLLADLASAREEFTRNVTQPLDVLDIVFPLMTDAERFSELAAIQRELARRIESAGDVGANDGYGDRVRLVDLAEEQRRVRAELATLLEDIRDDAAKLPEDEPFGRLKREAVAFASSVARGPIPDLMDRAASALEKNDAKAGGRSATAAANEMEKLIKRCTEVSDQAERCLRFQPALARSLGDTIRQLLAGQGSGKGGPGGGLHGYSMRDPRRALGLYGKVVLSEARQQGASTAGARGSGEGAHPPTRLDDSGGSGDDHVPAAGVPARELPPAYRQQIRHYLERLAEELAGGRR